MFITLSKEKYENLKKKLSKDNIPYRVEVTQEGLFHVTFKDLNKQILSEVFDEYLKDARKDEEGDKYPDWVKYLTPKKTQQDTPQKQKEAAEYA